jgi:porin
VKSKLNKLLLLFVMVVVIGSLTALLPVFAEKKAPAKDVERTSRHKSGRKNVPEFGGPSSVGGKLKEAAEVTEPRFRIPVIDHVIKPWFDFKAHANRKLGLRFNLDYQALYQVADESPGEDEAAAGLFRFYGEWALFGRDTSHPGNLVYKVEHGHRLGTDISPEDLNLEIGAILPTGDSFTEFRNSSWAVTNLYWQQRFLDGRITFVAGNVDPSDYVDTYGLNDPQTHFQNLAFLTNPTIAMPDQGLGAAFGLMVTDNVYVVSGLSDANGDPTVVGFDTFFDDNEYFKHLEIGWISSFERRFLDNIHLTAWHVDDREKAQVPDSWGLAFSLTRFIDDKWMPFIQAGWSDGDASPMETNVSAGIARYFSKHRDLIGLGVSWGQPSDNSLHDQYTAEFFYRLQLTQSLAITPDAQMIIDPALNPGEDVIGVFGLRVRLTF